MRGSWFVGLLRHLSFVISSGCFMLILPPVPYRRRRRVKASPTPPAGVALVLVSAEYNESDGTLALQFDRAINIAALNGAAITVHDGSSDDTTYNGVSAASLTDPKTVLLTLVPVGSYGVDEVTMTVTALSGIVAVNDGGTW